MRDTGMYLVCALNRLVILIRRIVKYGAERYGRMYVTNVKILLITKEQAVKAGTVVSTS